MKTRMICAAIAIFAILIFWGNYLTTQSDAQGGKVDCKDCSCTLAVGLPAAGLQLMGGLAPSPSELEEQEKYLKSLQKQGAKESCSVVFKNKAGETVIENLAVSQVTNFSCGIAVFCGRGRNAGALCGRKPNATNFQSYCEYQMPSSLPARRQDGNLLRSMENARE